ncbi:MAG: hypothetical protein V4578_09800 [Pseudomonadota bacterium]
MTDTYLKAQRVKSNPVGQSTKIANKRVVVVADEMRLIVDYERAICVDGGYLVLKLPDDAVRPQTVVAVDTSNAALRAMLDAEFAVFRRESLPLHLSVSRPGRKDAAALPAENVLFMHQLNAQEMAHRSGLLEKGDLLTSRQLCEQLRIGRQALNKAVHARRIFSLTGPSGRQLYPAFYAAAQLARSQLEKVTQALGDLPGPSKWQFFTTPKGSLGGKTPLRALESGDLGPVLVTAAGFRER